MTDGRPVSELLARQMVQLDRRLATARRHGRPLAIVTRLEAQRDQVVGLRMNLLRHQWDTAHALGGMR